LWRKRQKEPFSLKEKKTGLGKGSGRQMTRGVQNKECLGEDGGENRGTEREHSYKEKKQQGRKEIDKRKW